MRWEGSRLHGKNLDFSPAADTLRIPSKLHLVPPGGSATFRLPFQLWVRGDPSARKQLSCGHMTRQVNHPLPLNLLAGVR